MGEQAGDEAVGLLGEPAGPVRVIEHVLAVLKEGHIRVHAAAVYAENRLRHEGGVQAVVLGEGLYHHAEGHDVVRRGERVGILEVYLVLAGGDLVVAGLYFKAHLLQGEAYVAAGGLAVVHRAEVEVSCLVAGLAGRLAVGVHLEEEKLALGADVEGIAHGSRALQHRLQHMARVADKGRAVGVIDVADEPRGAPALGLPGQHHEGVRVGIEVLVALVDAGEALDGAAVYHDLVIQGLFQLPAADGNVLQLAENVGELHADELNVLFSDDADDILAGVPGHL